MVIYICRTILFVLVKLIVIVVWRAKSSVVGYGKHCLDSFSSSLIMLGFKVCPVLMSLLIIVASPF